MEQHHTITFEGHTLHYRDEGKENKQTIVLIHGFLQNLSIWSSYTLSYMKNMRVIAIDLPGHGYSDCYSDVHTMDFMAKCIMAVLSEAGVEQCVMVGHSLGGYVALAFAERYPFMLKGLCLINSHAFADTEEKKASRLKICQKVQVNRPGFIVDFIPNLFSESRREALSAEIKEIQDQSLDVSEQSIIAAQYGMMQRPSRIALLQRFNKPIFFVIGKNDNRIPIEYAVSQVMEARRGEMLLLEGVGHMAHLEEREYVKIRLSNFVNTCYC